MNNSLKSTTNFICVFSINCSGFYFLRYFVCWHPVMYVINIYQNDVYIENGKEDILARKLFGVHFYHVEGCADPLFCC